MKTNKLFTKIFAAFMFIAAFSILNIGLASKAKAATSPVQLYYSQRITDDDYDIGHVEGYIAVQNLAFQKNVYVHYSLDGGKTWTDSPASYVKTNPSDGYEVWKFKTNSSSEEFGPAIMYCFKYEVNGQTYWDNNNGKNYTDGAFGKLPLYVNQINSGTYNGQKYVSFSVAAQLLTDTNIMANSKLVKVRYTEDNWATYKDVDANFISSGGTDSAAQWAANLKISDSTKQVQFSVLYDVNGTQYWDNNFGSNYVVNY